MTEVVNNPALSLTPASDADLDAVAALVNHAYRGAGGWTSEGHLIAGQRTSAADLRADLARAPDASILTWRDPVIGELLGAVWLQPADGEAWYLGMLTVRNDQQDRKLGRTLLGASETFAATRGATRIRMTVVSVRDALIEWYERRGYQRTGEMQPFPYEDRSLGTPRRPGLMFVVLEKALAAGPQLSG